MTMCNIGFWKKRQFFGRKLSNFAEISDHNIDPWSLWSQHRRIILAELFLPNLAQSCPILPNLVGSFAS
jgi:hypothetical protein